LQQRHLELGRSPIGHDGEIDAGRGLEQLGRQVLGTSDIDGPDIERAGPGFRGGDKVLQRLEFRVGAGREDEIEKSQAGNRLEIPQRIEWQFREQRDADRGPVGQ
jgi:hypothetical protein